jgi:DNA topoisomerase-3
LITYPRSACAYLPESLHVDAIKIVPTLIPNLIDSVQMDSSLVDTNIKSKAFDDKKLDGESHFAIIPTGVTVGINNLERKEFELFNLISLQYLAQFLPNLKFEQTTGAVICSGYSFKFSGKVINSLGWKELFIKNNLLMGHKDEDNSEDDKDIQKLPQLSLGQNVNYSSHNLQKSTTTKPKPYTEGSLIKTMANIHNSLDEILQGYYSDITEAKKIADRYKKTLKETAGLGTEATRASIIKVLKTRAYVVNKGKNLEITDKGISFMQLVKGKAPVNLDGAGYLNPLTSPLTTAIYEEKLDDILNHKVEASVVYADTINVLLGITLDDVKHQYNELPAPAKKQQSGTTTGDKCPECGSDIIERDGQYGKWRSCSSYPKCKWKPPQAEKPKAELAGKKCDKCGKEMVKRKSKDGTKEFLACSGYPECKNVEWL